MTCLCPERRNALNATMVTEIVEVFDTGGERYPKLDQTAGRADLLSAILAPKLKPAEPAGK